MDGLAAVRAGQAAGADVQALGAARLAHWASWGVLSPSQDDVGLLRILLLAILPNSAGFLLLIARR